MSFYFFNSLKNSKFQGQNVDIFEISHREKPYLNSLTVRDLAGVTHNVQSFNIYFEDITELEILALINYYNRYKSDSSICDNVVYRIGFGTNYLVTTYFSSSTFNQITFQIISENRKYLSYNDMRSSLLPNGTITNGVISAQSGVTGGPDACVILVSTNYMDKEYIGYADISKIDKKTLECKVFKKSDLEELGGVINVNKHDDTYGDISSGGGYGGGSFDNTSDAIGVPQVPSIGVTSTGFINVYNPSLGELEGFGDELFPDFSEHQFTSADSLEAIANNIAEVGATIYDLLKSFINSNLINYVLDCHIIPCVPTVSDKIPIKVGFKTFPQQSAKVTSDYVTVDCGTLEIAEYYQNFIDYVGTTAKLYLPFVGFVGIEPEYFQNGKLKVTYSFNVIDGSFMAFVLSTSSKSNLKETVIGSFGGNCCVHIPITGVNYSSMISGIVQGVTTVASSGLTSYAGKLLTKDIVEDLGHKDTNYTQNDATRSSINVRKSQLNTASSALSLLSAKPTYESSNSYNSNSAYMGIRIPYLLISRPVSSFSDTYTKENGLPLNVSKKLESVKGMTVASNLVLDGLSCTAEEKNMIKALFEEGVIL